MKRSSAVEYTVWDNAVAFQRLLSWQHVVTDSLVLKLRELSARCTVGVALIVSLRTPDRGVRSTFAAGMRPRHGAFAGIRWTKAKWRLIIWGHLRVQKA